MFMTKPTPWFFISDILTLLQMLMTTSTPWFFISNIPALAWMFMTTSTLWFFISNIPALAWMFMTTSTPWFFISNIPALSWMFMTTSTPWFFISNIPALAWMFMTTSTPWFFKSNIPALVQMFMTTSTPWFFNQIFLQLYSRCLWRHLLRGFPFLVFSLELQVICLCMNSAGPRKVLCSFRLYTDSYLCSSCDTVLCNCGTANTVKIKEHALKILLLSACSRRLRSWPGLLLSHTGPATGLPCSSVPRPFRARERK